MKKATCTFADVSEIFTLNKIREFNFYTVILSLFLGNVKALVKKLQEKYWVTHC